MIGTLLAVGLFSGCPRPAKGSERDGRIVRRIVDEKPRLTPQQIEQQAKLKRLAAKRRVTSQRAVYVTKEEEVCKQDSDCTLVAQHCCSCDYRGRLVGINRARVPLLAVRRTGVCQEYKCIAEVSDHESCTATRAICRAGKCVPDIKVGTPKPSQGLGVEPIEGANASPPGKK